MKKISVIVPVYNGEKFITRCLDSILNQTYTNWELIIVDDGSTDNTVGILKKYKKKDTRIRYYKQENKGAGSARNLGLNYATGDYLVFVDSDDWIESQYFETLSLCDEDVVFIDVNRICEGKKKTEYMSYFSKFDKNGLIRCQLTGFMPWGGWRKAVKSSIIKKNKIKYSEHKVGEEAVFSFNVMYFSTSIKFLKDRFYNYEIHQGSLSQTYNLDPWWDVSIALKDYIRSIGCYELYADTINSFLYISTIIALNRHAKNLPWSKYKSASKNLISRLDRMVDRKYGVDKIHISKQMRLLIPLLRFKPFIFTTSKIYKNS